MSDVLKRSDVMLSKLLIDITEEDDDEKTKNETIADLKKQLQQGQEQMQQLNVKLSLLQENAHKDVDQDKVIADLNKQLDGLYKDRMSQRVELDTWDAAKKTWDRERQALDDELQSVRAELEAMTGRKEAAEKAEKEAKGKIIFNTKDAEIAELKKKLHDGQQAYLILEQSATQEHINQLEEKLENAKTTNESLKAELHKLEGVKTVLLDAHNNAQKHEEDLKANLHQRYEHECNQKIQQWQQQVNELQERLKQAQAAPKAMGLGINDAEKFRLPIERVKDIFRTMVEDDENEHAMGGPLTEYIKIDKDTYDFTILTNGIKLLSERIEQLKKPSSARGQPSPDSSLMSETPPALVMAQDSLKVCEEQLGICEAEKRHLQNTIKQKNEDITKLHTESGAAAFITHMLHPPLPIKTASRQC